MQISVEITLDDTREHYQEMWSKAEKSSLKWQIIEILIWVAVTTAYLIAFGPINSSHIVLFFLVLILFSMTSAFRERLLRKNIVEDQYNPALSAASFTFDAEGITHKSELSRGMIPWGLVTNIDETSNLLRIFFGTYDALLIPKRFLNCQTEFVKTIESLKNAA